MYQMTRLAHSFNHNLACFDAKIVINTSDLTLNNYDAIDQCLVCIILHSGLWKLSKRKSCQTQEIVEAGCKGPVHSHKNPNLNNTGCS